MVKEMEKVIQNPQPDSSQHQNLLTSRGSPLARAYHVWSTCVNTFVSYLLTEWQTDKQNQSHNSAFNV